jgi:hypothetical protein
MGEELIGDLLFPEPVPDWVVQAMKRGCRRPRPRDPFRDFDFDDEREGLGSRFRDA